MECNHYVYAHINQINGKIYVGQTNRLPEKRWQKDGKGYLYKNNNGTYKQPKFAHAILKYGWDNFEHKIIAQGLSQEQANNLERLLITNLDLQNSKNGYNMREGGQTFTLSDNTRKKISKNIIKYYEEHPEAHKAQSERMKKRFLDPEERKKISNANKGRILTELQRLNLSLSKMGEKNHMYGTHHSEETRFKMSESHKGKPVHSQSEETRKKLSVPVVQLTTDGKFIANFYGANEAAIKTGIQRSSITFCCQGKYKSAGNYLWKYASDYYNINSPLDVKRGDFIY